MLRTLSENKDNEYPQNLFEIDTTFNLEEQENTETGIKEQEKLCIALANNTANFTDIKQIWDYLARMLGKEYKIENPKKENNLTINERTGDIYIGDKNIGFIGELKPQLLENLSLKIPIALLEIDLNNLI